MSFYEKYLSENLKDPDFKQAWEETELEFIIARNIIRRRKRLGLTQKELAELMNTTQSVISRLESGNQNISVRNLKAIADVLQTNASSLLRDGPEVKRSRHKLVKS